MARIPPQGISPPEVFLDDSGTHARLETVCSWAGYWAQWAHWRAISEEWNKILDGPPRLEYWHSSLAIQRKPPFDVLNDAEYERRSAALFDLIGENVERTGGSAVLIPFRCSVAYADVKRYVSRPVRFARDLSRKETKILQPKTLARAQFIVLFYAARELARMNATGDQLSIYCEREGDDPYQDRMRTIWDTLRVWNPQRYGLMDFPRGKCRQYPQLQVADVLAWHLGCEAKGRPEPTWRNINRNQLLDKVLSQTELEEYAKRWRGIDPTDPKTWGHV